MSSSTCKLVRIHDNESISWFTVRGQLVGTYDFTQYSDQLDLTLERACLYASNEDVERYSLNWHALFLNFFPELYGQGVPPAAVGAFRELHKLRTCQDLVVFIIENRPELFLDDEQYGHSDAVYRALLGYPLWMPVWIETARINANVIQAVIQTVPLNS
jgi:hypothetical protein